MQKVTTWALAIGAAVIFSASYLLDGKTDADVAQAVAADLEDARHHARRAKHEKTVDEVFATYSQLAGSKR